jgi:hypothetical protein
MQLTETQKVKVTNATKISAIQIMVFKVNNNEFEPLGDISQYTSLLWPDAYIGYASFELWAPITEDNANLIKEGNIIWTGGENAAIIEIIKADVNDDGEKTYDVKGRTLEARFVNRIVWGTYTASNKKASTIMYGLVNSCVISPTKSARKLKWLKNAEDTQCGQLIASYQKTGGNVYDALESIATDSDVGFSVSFNPRTQREVFEVREGADRTLNNSEGNEPVIFSTELEDLLSSEYYMNNQDERNVAFVQGEDTGANRKSVIVGNDTLTGYERRELYVDARDLQSEVYNDDGTTTSLTPEEYNATLKQRGNEKLAECARVETFEAEIRQFGDVQYVYGEDYFKGDMVTVIDEQLGLMVSARITMVEEQYSEDYSLVLTFGYSYPTVLQKVKRIVT